MGVVSFSVAIHLLMGSFVVCIGLSDRTGLLTGVNRYQDGSLTYFVTVWRDQVKEAGSGTRAM